MRCPRLLLLVLLVEVGCWSHVTESPSPKVNVLEEETLAQDVLQSAVEAVSSDMDERLESSRASQRFLREGLLLAAAECEWSAGALLEALSSSRWLLWLLSSLVMAGNADMLHEDWLSAMDDASMVVMTMIEGIWSNQREASLGWIPIRETNK